MIVNRQTDTHTDRETDRQEQYAYHCLRVCRLIEYSWRAVFSCFSWSAAQFDTSSCKADVRHATKLSNFIAQLCWVTKLPVWLRKLPNF